jgi:hypothetical protein
MDIIASLTAVLLFSAGLVGVPLAVREWIDRRADRADQVGARVRAHARRLLGGDTLLRVEVRAPLAGRPGRIVLDAPAGWEWLIEAVWEPVARIVPPGYELIGRRGAQQPVAPAVAHPATLPRAA